MAAVPNMFVSNLLKQTGLFSEAQILELLTSVRMEEKGVTQTVVDDGYANEGDFLKAMADVLGLEYLRVGGDPIEVRGPAGDLLDRSRTLRLPQAVVGDDPPRPRGIDRAL